MKSKTKTKIIELALYLITWIIAVIIGYFIAYNVTNYLKYNKEHPKKQECYFTHQKPIEKCIYIRK